MPPTITQDWVPSRADIKKQVKFKFYQAHNEFIPTASASVLDPDATRLGMSLNGSYPVKISAIKDLETLSRDTIKILSQAEKFSFAAFQSLQSENMDSKVLLEILKSMSRSITDAMSIVTAQTLGLQQLRREAAIESAPKGFLTDEAKRKLRLSPFTSKLLFDGQVSTIYKENMTENQETLIRNAVFYSAKPVPSSSSKKPKAKSGKFSVKKCQVSTIKGYRSTISNTLKYKTGYEFGSHPVLSELIKSFAKQRPVDRPLAPKWDLAFVLSHMCKAPFEPLDKASLFYLSVKTIFLITLATARRVSEVHAFSIDSDHLRFSNLDGSLILRTQVGFLAKNQLPSRAPDSITIPKLSNFCRKSDNFNRMLCPVRAVKIYLNKTKSLRKHRKRLFIPIQGDQDLAKSTLSRWVRYAIKHAYSSISKNPNRLFKPRAHDLRALSASWAYMNYILLEEILKSAVWSCSSLFASHYLKDFREQAENLRAMGPIIAAQKVVGAVPIWSPTRTSDTWKYTYLRGVQLV